MVGTILPIVYGERLQGKQGIALGLHVLGTLAGAAGLGALLGGLGALVRADPFSTTRAALVLVALGCGNIIYAQHEFGLVRLPAPQSHWQVPRHWQDALSPRGAALAYGAVLGLGVFTRITSAAFYAVVAGVVFLGRPVVGALVLLAFGVGRVAPLLALGTATQDYDDLARWQRILDRWQPAMSVLTGLALAGSGGWLVGLAVARAWS